MKTKEQRALIREYRRHPIFWRVIGENESYLVAVNWLTGECQFCHKRKENKQ